jgi:hypothetical protein
MKISETINTENRYYKPLIVVGSLLYPLYALPWIIKAMVKNEYFGYLLFSWVMAYSSYLMIPYNDFDLTRHYESFLLMSNISFDEILIVDPRIKHYFFNIYMWLINEMGLSKQFVPFFITFIKYMLYFATFRRVLNAYPIVDEQTDISSKWLMVIFLFLLIGTIRFVGDTSGLRNSLAFSIFIYAIIRQYIDHKYILSLFLFILSIGVHLSIVPLILIFYFSIVLKFLNMSRGIFIIAAILLFTGMADKIFFFAMDILKPYLQASYLYFPDYMSPGGKWGSGFWVGQRMGIIILEKYLNPSVFYLAALYLLVVKDFTFDKIKVFLYLSFSFIVLVSISRTMLSRYAYFYELLLVFIIMSEYTTKYLTLFKKLFLIILVLSVLAIKLGGLYRYRIIYMKSWGSSMLVPAPVMMLRDVGVHNYIIPNNGS